jgi:hypothetical protein
MDAKITITGQTGPPCPLRVSDLESASLAGYCRAYAVQCVYAPLNHGFEFSYWRAGITIGRICPRFVHWPPEGLSWLAKYPGPG